MAYQPRKHRHRWTHKDVRHMREMARSNMPLHLIAVRMGRSLDAVRAKVAEAGLVFGQNAPPPRTFTRPAWWDA
jgi:hypothetical protein